MKNKEFMDEYLRRLAFSLAQFWPVNEELPDEQAREEEVFYRVSVRRLSFGQRIELAKKMHELTHASSGFFTPGTPPSERRRMIASVIDRFEQLKEATHDLLVLSDRI